MSDQGGVRRGAKASVAALVGVVVAGACTATPPGGVTSDPAVVPEFGTDVQLVSFDSCDEALGEFQAAAAPHVSAYGIGPNSQKLEAADGDVPVTTESEDTTDSSAGGRSSLEAPEAAAAEAPAAPGAADAQSDVAPGYSGTNVHTDGVDEADIVKTDGRRLVTVHGDTLRVVDLERGIVTGSLELSEAAPENLLMAGDRVLAISSSRQPLRRPGAESAPAAPDASIVPETGESVLQLIDIAGAPRLMETMQIDGGYTDARMTGTTARIVTRSSPRLPTVYPSGERSESSALDANKQAVEGSTIDDWLPQFSYESGGAVTSGPLVDCGDVSYPDVYSGMSMINVVTVDLAGALDAMSATSVLGDGQTVYASDENLYIADDHRMSWLAPAADNPDDLEDGDGRTEIHKFDISGAGQPDYVASGEVGGWLLNQYAMSEHEGHLRVATTLGEFRGAARPGQVPDTESQLVVLAESDGTLAEVGRVDGLGEGERIYSVRFIGPVGYVVTFREVDPLYTVDLSDPANPRVRGELKIPGYSAYLHPASDFTLIGVGQDGTETGQLTGAQVSLFDVSDLADPRRTDSVALDAASTEVERNPHAFLYWQPAELIVVPTGAPIVAEPQPIPRPDASSRIAPTPPIAGGATALRLNGDSLTEVGTIAHPAEDFDPGKPYADPTIRRSLVVDDTLWTVSAAGVMANAVSDLAERAWIPFE